MRRIDGISIHCAYTTKDMDIGAAEIRQWHLNRGWSDIGYHEVIRRDGTVEQGRPLEKMGAHVRGHNKHSIGICLAGGMSDDGKPEENFTPAQWDTLEERVVYYLTKFPCAVVRGHNEYPNETKACPCFIASEWWENLNNPKKEEVVKIGSHIVKLVESLTEPEYLKGLQTLLLNLGLYRGQIDGLYGRMTKNAVIGLVEAIKDERTYTVKCQEGKKNT